ncbi:hypothetical protein JCM24511_01160 [Saitozyma sp. JCM 24511]|nr:hypothetical protein JCM24511_01160 [Saitozyma sp. JCM 24511]
MLVSPETPSMGRTFFSVSSASASASTTTSTSPSFVPKSGAAIKAFQTFQCQPDMVHLRLPFGGGSRPCSIPGAGMTIKHWRDHQRRDYGTVSDVNDAGVPLADSQLIGKGRYVRIVEVSPRDGLQNVAPPAVPTEVKKELVERLLAAGVKNIEVGSFVRGDWVPQSPTPEFAPKLLYF